VKSVDFLHAAKALLKGNGKPRQVALRRSCSTTHYALFHTLCNSGANLLVGKGAKSKTRRAWTQVYRSLQHGPSKTACDDKKIVGRFPTAIQDFAHMYVTMQEKRHLADYDPILQVRG